MDHYSSPDPEMMALERGQMPMVRYAGYLLWTLVVIDLLGFLGALAGAIAVGVQAPDPMDQLPAIVGTVCVGLSLVVWAVPQIAAAIGLRRGAKWAWYLTIGIGGIYVLTCCPGVLFGAPLLFFMLNDEVREDFQAA